MTPHKIRGMREVLNLSQRDVAKNINEILNDKWCNQSSVSKWESGEHKIDAAYVYFLQMLVDSDAKRIYKGRRKGK